MNCLICHQNMMNLSDIHIGFNYHICWDCSCVFDTQWHYFGQIYTQDQFNRVVRMKAFL
jgi:hypothetical protein